MTCRCRERLGDGRLNRNPDGSVKEVTVACDVHHLMADGAPATLHEVLCPCGNFADDRECTLYLDEDGNPEHVCNGTGCAEVYVREYAFTLAPAITETRGHDGTVRCDTPRTDPC